MLWAKPEIEHWIGASLLTCQQMAEIGAPIEYQQGYVAALAALGAMFGILVKPPPIKPPRMIDQR